MKYKSSTLFLLISLFITPISLSQIDSIRLFSFGHSLIDHRPPAIPTPSDETTLLHWMHEIAQSAGNSLAAGGQYGFLPSHDNLPPISQWGYDNVPGVWDMDFESFADANINTILLTAANFIQYQPAHLAHPADNSTTVLRSTESIFDWVNQQEVGVRFYIYANWPEMDLASPFPPNLPLQSEIDAFHNQTTGAFQDWWVAYQDSMLNRRPAYQVRLIPIGPIISKILRDRLSNQIPFDEVYEDSDPHGRASLYFLAAMISYMAIYEEEVPANYMPGTIVHSLIRDSLASIRDFIWEELNAFEDADGDSRVFFDGGTTSRADDLLPNPIQLSPNPAQNTLTIRGLYHDANIEVLDIHGKLIWKISGIREAELGLNIGELPQDFYFLRTYDPQNDQYYLNKWRKN
ncbi:MAG: T9SS C-terminal target domain-containing protein [Bacteroidota bacterium]